MITKVESNEQYHQSAAISASGLKTIYETSVWHFLNKKPYTTSSMNLGTAVHTAILEPKQFYKDYTVMPKFDGRTKAGKEAKAEFYEQANLEQKEILEEADYEKITGILNTLNDKNLLASVIAKEYCQGEKEISHYLNFQGVDVRVRPDNINRIAGFISDVKTCQKNTPRAFRSDIYKYNYHLQAAFYSDALGLPPENFVFIACETNHPFGVQSYSLSDEMIEQGRNAYNKALSDWQFYLDTGVALGYSGYETSTEGVIKL